MFLVNSDMEKWAKAFPSSVQNYGSLCNSWSLTLLSDFLDIHNWSDYEEKDIGFDI